MNPSTHLVLACFTLVLLVAVVAVRMLQARIHEMRTHRIHPQQVATSRTMGEKLHVVQAADNYRNLFEMPVLFYAVCALALALNQATPLLAALAWAYVTLRLLHSWIHCTYNKVMHRLRAFGASCAVLAAMWVSFALSMARA
jgi:hypothetical protein